MRSSLAGEPLIVVTPDTLPWWLKPSSVLTNVLLPEPELPMTAALAVQPSAFSWSGFAQARSFSATRGRRLYIWVDDTCHARVLERARHVREGNNTVGQLEPQVFE